MQNVRGGDGVPAAAALAGDGAAADKLPFATLFSAIMLPMFLAVVDQTIVATALPGIAASLHNVERVSWVVISYLVANTIAAPVYGRLGDALGRRKMMMVALVVFILASLFCALAWNIEVLTVARLFQGLGGGGLMTLSQSLIGENIPARERPRYQGYLSAIVVCSSSFGPVAGGLLTQWFGWRSVFFINVPLGLLAMALTRRLPTVGGRREAWHFDVAGLVLFVAFVVPILLALEEAQHVQKASWTWVLGLLAVSVAALLLLLWQEKRDPSPLLPVALLGKASIWRCDALAAFHGASLVSMITFVPIYLRVARGATAGQIGLVLVPLTAGIGVGAVITSRLIARTGRTTIFPICGLALTTGMMLVFAFGLPRFSLENLAALLIATALFMGTTMGVVQITVQNAAGQKDLGAAAGSVQFARAIGAAFGTASVGALLFASLTMSAPDAAQIFGDLVEHGPALLKTLEPGRQTQMLAAIDEAFQAVFLLLAIFTTCGCALAASIPMRRL